MEIPVFIGFILHVVILYSVLTTISTLMRGDPNDRDGMSFVQTKSTQHIEVELDLDELDLAVEEKKGNL